MMIETGTLAIHKILVPTDFSECSREALRFAADLARRYGASITLVHVDNTMDNTASRSSLGDDKRELEEHGVTRVDCRSMLGKPFEEIIDLAGDGGYGMIVMGTHGESGRKTLSVAEAVMRNAPCPVVTIRTLRDRSSPSN